MTALWNPFLVEWCLLKIWLQGGKWRAFNPTCGMDVGLIGIMDPGQISHNKIKPRNMGLAFCLGCLSGNTGEWERLLIKVI
jgi:hypothetical protein